MNTSQMYAEIWTDLGDAQGMQYSFYNLTNALNFVLRNISNMLPRTSSDLKYQSTLTVSSGQATLPTGFLSLTSVYNGDTPLSETVGDETVEENTYTVRQNTMFVHPSISSIVLNYKKSVTEMDATNGEPQAGAFPLSDVYNDLVKRYAILYLQGQTAQSALVGMIQSEVKYIATTRSKSEIKPRQAFYV